MDFKTPKRLSTIADIIGAELLTNDDILLAGFNELHCVREGELVFVDHPKYYDKTFNSAASAILINQKISPPNDKAVLYAEDPFSAFMKLINSVYQFTSCDKNISDTANIGEGTVVQPGAFIGNGVQIGKNCLIHANASINNDCIIGDNVIIHSNAVIGADAFYYKKRADKLDKFTSCGRVVIHNDVEIGANTTIDRGVTSDTVLGCGTKIDNLVHIGHDTKIGERCIIAAQVGVAGATEIQDEVTIWGQVGINAKITIEKGVTILSNSAVANTLKSGCPIPLIYYHS